MYSYNDADEVLLASLILYKMHTFFPGKCIIMISIIIFQSSGKREDASK